MFNSYIKCLKMMAGAAIIMLVASFNVFAQLGDAGAILRAGTDDANKLMESYLNPFGKGFGASLNTGWFNTAKTHKKLGFDLSVNVGATIIPTGDQLFNVNDLGFSQLELLAGSPETPTISGENTSTTELGITFVNPQTNQNEELTRFTVPGGIGFPYVPAPMIQATIGLVKDTDVSIRYVPNTELADFGELGLFGIGVKHGLNQWLPGGSVLPIDISVQFGYTSFSTSASFNVLPDYNLADTYNKYPATAWDGQGIELETTASTYNIIVGKTLPLISLYGGVGYETSTTTLATPGVYPIVVPNQNYNPNASLGESAYPKTVDAINSPIDLEFVGDNSMRAFVGTRIKLAIIQLSASYTVSTYSSLNVGFGLTFR